MKALLTFILLLTFFSCKKEEQATPDCRTCQLEVDYSSSATGYQHYIADSKEFCDDGWKDLDGTLDPNSGSGTSGGGNSWTKTMVWHCK